MLEKIEFFSIYLDFLNLYEAKYNTRAVKSYLTLIKKIFRERLNSKLNLKIEFWLPSNRSQLVAPWTPGGLVRGAGRKVVFVPVFFIFKTIPTGHKRNRNSQWLDKAGLRLFPTMTT